MRAARKSSLRQLPVRLDKQFAGLHLVKQSEGLGGALDVAALCEAEGDSSAREQCSCRALGVPVVPRCCERLLGGRAGVPESANLIEGIRPAHEQLRALGFVRLPKLEGSREPPFCLDCVEAERAYAGEGEESASGDGELACLFLVACRLSELKRLQVVAGEHLGEVLDAFSGLAFDPVAAAR